MAAVEVATILAAVFSVSFCLSEDIFGSSPLLLFPSHSFLFQHIFSLSGRQMGFKRIMSSLGAGREQKETEALVAWGGKGALPGKGCEAGAPAGKGALDEPPTPSCQCWEGGASGGRAPWNLSSMRVGLRPLPHGISPSLRCAVGPQQTPVEEMKAKNQGTGLPPRP